MQIQSTQLRQGMLILHEGRLLSVTSAIHKTPGNLRGMVQTKLRDIKTGSNSEVRFRSEDKVERIILDQHEMEFLYADGDDFHFMNTESYEQVAFNTDVIGDASLYLVQNTKIKVSFYEGQPIGIELPNTVELKVVETDPGLKTATISASKKPATLETGVVVQVPQFVGVGDVIKVDTRDGIYLDRAK